jgi:SAM-dependent methyltransferase
MIASQEPNSAPTAPLYSELPYPADGIIRTTSARILRAGLARHAPALLERPGLRIIDVGCGTGEVLAGLVQMFPGSEVVGVDINPPSLDKARALLARHKMNVPVLQADLTEDLAGTIRAAGIDPEFDVVTSLGVLHHLRDPSVGFRAVRQLIAPQGLFFCFMYSRHGRREDMAIKQLLDETLPAGADFSQRTRAIRSLALQSRHTPMSMLRQLGQRLRFGPPLLPLEQVSLAFHRHYATHASDTYSNPCEHLYGFGELRELARTTAWNVLGLAEGGGLPTTVERHTLDPRRRAFLRSLSMDALYDYFAFHYQALGFNFFLEPVGAAGGGFAA